MWQRSDSATVETKIRHCRSELTKWTREQNQNSALVIKEAQSALEATLSSEIPNPNSIAHFILILEQAYRDEEALWKQRSRIAWLNSRDLNTAYFHAITRERRTHNRFTILEDSSSTSFYKEKDIARVITEYFKTMFSSIGQVQLDVVEDIIQPCVSPEMNATLIAIPSDDEIRAASLTIDAKKAPGPDGFTTGFFHSYWQIIGPDIIKEIREFFLMGTFPHKMNKTHIRLILKITGLRKVADCRPIALCNTYYKIVAIILTKRLQPILSSLILENQLAFVPQRAISDNVLITHEILHYLKISGATKRRAMAVKTDMSKAYDRIV